MATDLFDQVQLGYMVVESRKLADWRRFAEKGLGLHVAHDSDDLLAFRIDDHQRRLIIRRGPAEDVVALGMELASDDALAEVQSRLAARGVTLETGDAAGAADRGVAHYWHFSGPKGLAIEMYRKALTTDEPLWCLSSGFVTGAGGMGHAAITARQPEKMLRFWQEIFDARKSDYIEERIAGATLDITFLRFNERHHSLAVAATRGVRLDPIRTQVQHVNLLVATLDDLAQAFKRLRELGYPMAHEMGQHPNDKEVSFYVVTPSGFELELGWDALTVDELTWQETDYYGISLWGHKPGNQSLGHFVKTNTANLGRGLSSLLRPEYYPF